jgi:hypothetical protein
VNGQKGYLTFFLSHADSRLLSLFLSTWWFLEHRTSSGLQRVRCYFREDCQIRRNSVCSYVSRILNLLHVGNELDLLQDILYGRRLRTRVKTGKRKRTRNYRQKRILNSLLSFVLDSAKSTHSSWSLEFQNRLKRSFGYLLQSDQHQVAGFDESLANFPSGIEIAVREFKRRRFLLNLLVTSSFTRNQYLRI